MRSASTIKVLIADDEKYARKRLVSLLDEYKDITVIFEAHDGDQVMDYLKNNILDAAFLDINMPGAPVFSTIEQLEVKPLIIFQTAYSDYAVDAFGVDALDYLMKPVSRERLGICVKRLREALEKSEGSRKEKADKLNQIALRHGESIKVISVDAIIRISFEEGFSFIYTGEGRFISDKSLNHYEEILPGGVFFRSSRNDIVNIKKISKIHPMFKSSYLIELVSGDKVQLSRRRAKDLRELIDF